MIEEERRGGGRRREDEVELFKSANEQSWSGWRNEE